MIALFNNQLTENEITIRFNDRALQFGDGLFETIKVENGKPGLLDYHLRRLHLGGSALGINIPDYLRAEQLKKSVTDLMHLNHMQDNANVKLIVWRGNEKQRAYASDDHHAQTLLMVRSSKNGLQVKNSCSFSQEVRLHFWKLSQFKTISALPYVTAARERDQRKLDELILLNVHDHVTECTSSNIYWVKDEVIYTPSIKTGCIAGVKRAYLLHYFKEKDIPCQEVESGPDQLLQADALFTSNSQGLHAIRSIDDFQFSGSALLDRILADIK